MNSPDPVRRNLYLVLGAFFVVALGIGAAGYGYYLNQKAEIKGQQRNELAAIAQLKMGQIANWRRERLSDARIVGATGVSEAVHAFLSGRRDARTREDALAWLQEMTAAAGYANAIVVDRKGKSWLAVGRGGTAGEHYAALAKQVIERGEIFFTDFHVDEGFEGPHLGLNIPLRMAPKAQPEGSLLLGIDPNVFLYPLINTWPTPSATAETLLARREGNDVVYLNELRHRKGTALKLRFRVSDNRELPAARGALGFEGVTEGLDYRGVPVLAAVRQVPDSPWFVIAKVDLEEIYTPVRQQTFWLALILCAVVLAIGAGARLLVREFRLRYYQQRYQAEIERRALLGHYDYLSRFANDIILLTDEAGRIIEANDRALAAYGYEKHELIGKPLRDLRDVVGGLSTIDSEEELEGKEALVLETRHRRKDGTTFPVEISARRIAVEGGVFRQSIIRDITERLKLQDQLQQAQKMESIGRLAGGVAHDFNNLLTIIGGYTSFALEGLSTNDPLRGPLTEVLKAGERAASLTQQLLAFSRKQVVEPQLLNLNDIVSELCKMLDRIVGEDITVVTRLEPSLGRVFADPNQIQQVLLNFATNARDAMPAGGTLTIETQNMDITGEYVAVHAGTTVGGYVLLTVSDTGIGMDSETQRQAFEPFFTTKPKSQGTGLGLAMVYGIVKQSNGWIWVYSEPGKGSSFKVYLPRISEDVKGFSHAHAAEPASDLTGTETILVVEDQADVRKLVVEALDRYGYRVLKAEKGSEALLLAQSFSEPIHLMITDVVMPGMTGAQLADRMRELRPDMKVMYMSGYSENVIAHQGVLDPGLAYLPKPFTPAALAQKVRAVLAET